uniref:glutamine--tRNA ligase n=1 Tax=Pyramimonas obovata TaxID=1411642 RepID=A0A7S0NAU1_9CHLO|mmetsp:Transcript_23033/g.50503  ORF Transcript_23033/g.50503 Transcript_23033/m.50503 type:complete len:775 (+) Transcript_23033:92-2416(+)
MEDLVANLVAIGVDEKKAQEAAKNKKLSATLVEVLKEAGVPPCESTAGKLVYFAATKFPGNALSHRPFLLKYIIDGKLKSDPMVLGALDYLGKLGSEPVNVDAFEAAGGVGQETTPEQIKEAVTAVIEAKRDELLEQRYRLNIGLLLADVRKQYPFGDMKLAKDELEKAQLALLGPKTEADMAKPAKKKAPKEEKPKEAKKAPEPEGPPPDPYKIFPAPDENNKVHTEIHFSDGDIWRPANTPAKLEEHLKATGGKVWTRFPPEPNGYLHIGHAKAMNVDFGFAKEYGGVCYLRYDDTNPAAESMEYIDHIQEIVKWMGWEPWKITYSSDYFQELYDFAVELIRKDKAYVDHQTKEEIVASRETHTDSPWRNRPIEESLRLFEEMRDGKWEEGKATLRMKMDMKNANFNMYDLIAYRIKHMPHPHAGDKWCIYPSYDYTHCIVDALENITHSLCTLEFESRRASYYWLLQCLDTYLPYVWEYARLNITNTVLSKRKLNALVTDKHVHGWDDPRLLTLSGLRRRGAPSAAINTFCASVGITRNENMVGMHLLEHFIREDLNKNAPRTMLVAHPLKMTLVNHPGDKVEVLETEPPIGPKYKVPFGRTVYIEKSDFREEDSKDYYGLAPGKTVMLRWAYPVKCLEVVKDAAGEVVELKCEYDTQKSVKPKGVIHWVGEPAPGVAPVQAELRLYGKLFKSEDVNACESWLEDLNPESLVVVRGALVTAQLAEAPVRSTFQAERVGYFCVDEDSTPAAPVLNRTVTLKEDLKVQAIKKQ